MIDKIKIEKSVLKGVGSFTDPTANRYALSAVEIERDSGVLEVRASDGRALAIYRTNQEGEAVKLLNGTRQFASHTKAGRFTTAFIDTVPDSEEVVIESHDSKTTAKQTEGRFPKVHDCFPPAETAPDAVFGMNIENFCRWLKGVKDMATSETVKISYYSKPGAIRIDATGPDGEVVALCMCCAAT